MNSAFLKSIAFGHLIVLASCNFLISRGEDIVVTDGGAPSSGDTTSGGSSGDNQSDPPAEEAPSVIVYAVTVPSPSGKIFGDHDLSVRTLSFSHNADSAECSHDGGSSYAACDSESTLIYSVDDYNNSHVLKIRFTKGSSSDTYTWTPHTALAGLQFLACGVTVATNQTAAEFQALLAGGNAGSRRVVCLNPGVTVNAAATARVVMSADYLDVVGTNANAATLYYVDHSADVSNEHTNRLINLNLRSDAAHFDYAFNVSGQNSVTLYHCNVSTTGFAYPIQSGMMWPKAPLIKVDHSTVYSAGTEAILINHAGWHMGSLEVADSDVQTDGEWSDAIYVNGNNFGSVVISGSTVRSNVASFGAALNSSRKGVVSITNSTLFSKGYTTVDVYNDEFGLDSCIVTISGSTITHGGPATALLRLNTNTQVTVTNSTFKAGANVGSADTALIYLDDVNNKILSGGGNTVCREGAPTFTTFIGGSAPHAASNFADPLPVSLCP